MYRKLIAAAGIIATFAVPLAAQNISLAPDPASPLDGFGATANNGVAAIGQSFTTPAGGNYLTNFSFFLANDADTGPGTGSDLQFRAYVYAWDGTGTTGNALFTSAIRSGADGSAFQEYAFDTGFLALTPGDSYVAFLSAAGITQNGVGYNALAGTDDSYAGGSLVFGDDAASLSGIDGTNAGFKAGFANTTPEPGEFALLGTGLVGLAGFVKRRRSLLA